MTINLQTGGFTPPPSLPGARSADIQVEQKQPVITHKADAALPPVGSPNAGDADAGEAKRYEQVAQASQELARDFYPVSDKRFTIFKDTSGQYITRYTSLRDGTVTYVPEQRLLQKFESHQSSIRRAIVRLQA